MYDYLINEYVNKLSLKEIEDFASKQGIELNDTELDVIYETIKNNWRTFVHGNPRPILEDLKTKVRSITYNKIEALYVEARNKYLK